MAYGIIEYDEKGNPICEICRKPFKRVLNHARQKHNISEKEYKKKFGFDLYKGICSQESANKSREKLMLHYDKVVSENLLQNGKTTRFKKGSKGRTRDQVSEQTRLRLANNRLPNNTFTN